MSKSNTQEEAVLKEAAIGRTSMSIVLLQRHLASFRKILGWSPRRLADEMGVTRQTVVNLESGRTTMSKTQYLALRMIFLCAAVDETISEDDRNLLTERIYLTVDTPSAHYADQVNDKNNSKSADIFAAATTALAISIAATNPFIAGVAAGVGATTSKATLQALENIRDVIENVTDNMAKSAQTLLDNASHKKDTHSKKKKNS